MEVGGKHCGPQVLPMRAKCKGLDSLFVSKALSVQATSSRLSEPVGDLMRGAIADCHRQSRREGWEELAGCGVGRAGSGLRGADHRPASPYSFHARGSECAAVHSAADAAHSGGCEDDEESRTMALSSSSPYSCSGLAGHTVVRLWDMRAPGRAPWRARPCVTAHSRPRAAPCGLGPRRALWRGRACSGGAGPGGGLSGGAGTAPGRRRCTRGGPGVARGRRPGLVRVTTPG